jgi:putative transposase
LPKRGRNPRDSHISSRLLREGERRAVGEAFSFIAAEKANYPVAVMCRVIGVNRTSFHDWERRPPSDRALQDAWLTEKIRQIHDASRGVYGAPRVHAELRLEHGIRVGRKRVARLMKAASIAGVRPRQRWRTTIRVPGVAPAMDLVERDFRPAGPNVLWVADITYLRSGEGWLYLAAVQDSYSRAIVGWSMATHMRATLVVDALRMALGRRRPGPGLIHHSDQGSQPGLNRSSQQCVRGVNVRSARDGCAGFTVATSAGVTRLSSRRPARRAGRSGDSRVRAGRGRRHEAP